MKKRILTLFLLMIFTLPCFCRENFWDGYDQISIDCMFTKNGNGDYWAQGCDLILKDMYSKVGLIDTPIRKISTNDKRLINKALQKFEFMKDETYLVSIDSRDAREMRFFFILITDVKGENYWWDWVGRRAQY